MNLQPLAIIGPTAVGKTNFFFKLITDGFPFEAISADSRQVYRHMDIGTGKDIPANFESKIWLINEVDPDQPFSSALFCRLAAQAVAQIQASDKLPVIIGGTGRYIKDFESSPSTLLIPPNPKLRQQLSALSLPELQARIKLIDPDRFQAMNNSDQHNPRRLIRAIEVKTNPPPSSKTTPHQLNLLGLTAPLQLIKSKIEARVHQRMNQGMVDEVKFLLKQYPQFSTFQSAMTPGYQEIIRFLNHQLTLDAAIEQWIKRETDYAKRQLTWFNHQAEAVWFDISNPTWYADAVKQLQRWGYASNYP